MRKQHLALLCFLITRCVQIASGQSSPQPGIGGYTLSSPDDRAFAFDYDGTGKLDHLVLYRPGTGLIWILQRGSGNSYFAVSASVTGIGGYDLSSPADRIFPFDYDGSRKLDHLVLYRPGTGLIWILQRGGDNSYFAVSASVTGIGGYDLSSPADRIFPFDYDGSGKLDHLVLYRPGTGVIWILQRGSGNSFFPVYGSGTGIGGYDLSSTADRIFAFDYDSSGKLDHLVLYRPGSGVVWILQHGSGNSFFALYGSGSGIGGYAVASPNDRAFAFDYDSSGKSDHLVFYCPGTGVIWILQHGSGNSFSPEWASGTGIGGYDLKSTADRIFAFDYDSSGKADHLFLFRPGTGVVWIEQESSGTFSSDYVSAAGPFYAANPAKEYIYFGGRPAAIENIPH